MLIEQSITCVLNQLILSKLKVNSQEISLNLMMEQHSNLPMEQHSNLTMEQLHHKTPHEDPCNECRPVPVVIMGEFSDNTFLFFKKQVLRFWLSSVTNLIYIVSMDTNKIRIFLLLIMSSMSTGKRHLITWFHSLNQNK